MENITLSIINQKVDDYDVRLFCHYAKTKLSHCSLHQKPLLWKHFYTIDKQILLYFSTFSLIDRVLNQVKGTTTTWLHTAFGSCTEGDDLFQTLTNRRSNYSLTLAQKTGMIHLRILRSWEYR